ncbi:hypothetical protein B4119_1283 [Parageobacillus caldoxylosilyticus]|uniref:Uncharacterized protein n=1 Tax=Saccharococcus caldoxylosilyticus TaxID=81408 RepID=A0A150L4Z2_9BACL|nr:hypothetical protein B4119_1283 [Parageobacillus caldoxylosilyticus]
MSKEDKVGRQQERLFISLVVSVLFLSFFAYAFVFYESGLYSL